MWSDCASLGIFLSTKLLYCNLNNACFEFHWLRGGRRRAKVVVMLVVGKEEGGRDVGRW